MRELLIIALVLACPLMMVLMMRGGHGHGGHAQARGDESGNGEGEISREPNSSAELRRRRDELDRLIEERESQVETPTPIGGGWR